MGQRQSFNSPPTLALETSEAYARQRLTKTYQGVTRGDHGASKSSVKGVSTHELVYGEITWKGIDTLLQNVPMKGADFVDLGSGNGKVVHYVALKYPVRMSRGVEIVPTRHEEAMRAHDSLKKDRHLSPVQLSLGNFRTLSMRKPTHVYTCSTCFSDETMRDIVRNMLRYTSPSSPKYLLTQKRVIDDHNGRIQLFRHVPHVQVTWRKEHGVDYYVYKLT